jgi:hypothetical protein
MKIGQRVMTIHGYGTAMHRESLDTGSPLYNRYCVKLENYPIVAKEAHEENGGVFLCETQMEVVDDDTDICQHNWFDLSPFKTEMCFESYVCLKCKARLISEIYYSAEQWAEVVRRYHETN